MSKFTGCTIYLLLIAEDTNIIKGEINDHVTVQGNIWHTCDEQHAEKQTPDPATATVLHCLICMHQDYYKLFLKNFKPQKVSCFQFGLGPCSSSSVQHHQCSGIQCSGKGSRQCK